MRPRPNLRSWGLSLVLYGISSAVFRYKGTTLPSGAAPLFILGVFSRVRGPVVQSNAKWFASGRGGARALEAFGTGRPSKFRVPFTGRYHHPRKPPRSNSPGRPYYWFTDQRSSASMTPEVPLVSGPGLQATYQMVQITYLLPGTASSVRDGISCVFGPGTVVSRF